MKVILDHTEVVAKNVQTFWFKAEQPVRYIAGQFIEMYLPHDNPDERGQKHWFTLSSSPTEKLIAITTKHATGQVSTFKQALFGMKPGDEATISEPMGDFVLPKDKSIPLVFVAGGIGITPMRSMVKLLMDTNEQRGVHIIYAAKTADELVFRELFETYNAKLDFLLSSEGKRLGAELVLELTGNNPSQLIYVSGPEPMVETLEAGLKGVGIKPEKLVLDFFPNYPA